MKKNLLIATLLCAFTVGSYGQGLIPFSAGSGKIKYTTDGSTLISVPAGNPAQVGTFGNINLAFYAAANNTVLGLSSGAPNLSSWLIQTSSLLQQVGPPPGGALGTTATADGSLGAAGTTLEVELVAWTGTYTSFSSALTAAQNGQALIGWSGSTLSTGALGWSQPTGTSQSPAILVTGSGGFNGIVLAPVPEPTTLALGGLGAAALLLFRRRK